MFAIFEMRSQRTRTSSNFHSFSSCQPSQAKGRTAVAARRGPTSGKSTSVNGERTLALKVQEDAAYSHARDLWVLAKAAATALSFVCRGG